MTKIGGRQIWDMYAKGVGGFNFKGQPLPDYDDLGYRQKNGWATVAESDADTAKGLYEDYCRGVNNMDWKGDPLPYYEGLGTQQSGWIAIALNRMDATAITEKARRLCAICAEGNGGVNYQGEPLPTYDELGDTQKNGWAEVVKSTLETGAGLYGAYYRGVGGVGRNGQPLPDWEGLGSQQAGWLKVAESRII